MNQPDVAFAFTESGNGDFWYYQRGRWSLIPRLPGETNEQGFARIKAPNERIVSDCVAVTFEAARIKEAASDAIALIEQERQRKLGWVDTHTSGAPSWDAVNLPLRELQSGDVDSIAVNTRWQIPKEKL